ncbi:MAG: hypothetical protein JXR03_18760 [Cyclobacteriaceae bacterium]
MSRYDFRFRRQVFRNRNIERHQDFHFIEKRYAARKRTQGISRLIVILIALAILIGIAIFTANADQRISKHAPIEYRPEREFRSVPDRL